MSTKTTLADAYASIDEVVTAYQQGQDPPSAERAMSNIAAIIADYESGDPMEDEPDDVSGSVGGDPNADLTDDDDEEGQDNYPHECDNCGTPINEFGWDPTGSRRCDDTDPHHRYHAAADDEPDGAPTHQWEVTEPPEVHLTDEAIDNYVDPNWNGKD